jgi:hypothetical protein
VITAGTAARANNNDVDDDDDFDDDVDDGPPWRATTSRPVATASADEALVNLIAHSPDRAMYRRVVSLSLSSH